MSDFTLAYDRFVPEEEGLREALTSTGNGYFCTRGAAEWEDAHDVHYPGTYAHGGYNRETTIMGGRPVLNEDLVNLPIWLVLKLLIEGGEAIGFDNVELLSYRHELDVRNAVVIRELRFRDRAGRETALRSRRFVSMAHVHQAGIEWTVTPENWSGSVELITALDGRVTNRGVARYRELEGRHLDPVSPRTFGAEVIALKVQTRQSNLYVAEAARTRAYRGEDLIEVERGLYQMEDYIQQVLAFDVRQGAPARVEKMVAFYTSHDRAINETLGSAGKSAARYPSFAEALERHGRAWEELWGACDLRLPSNERVQLLLRLHISHILQVCSRHTADLDAGVPARGLNGEAYRGHVFWDELYVSHPSPLSEAGTAGHRSQSALELGHHQTAGPSQVDLLLPLRDPGRLQPLRGRLDGGVSRNRRIGQAAHRIHLRQAEHRPRPVDPPCRPRLFHDLPARGLLDGGSGRHQDSQPPLCFRRQPLFRKPLPHPEVPARLPRTLRLHPG